MAQAGAFKHIEARKRLSRQLDEQKQALAATEASIAQAEANTEKFKNDQLQGRATAFYPTKIS